MMLLLSEHGSRRRREGREGRGEERRCGELVEDGFPCSVVSSNVSVGRWSGVEGLMLYLGLSISFEVESLRSQSNRASSLS